MSWKSPAASPAASLINESIQDNSPNPCHHQDYDRFVSQLSSGSEGCSSNFSLFRIALQVLRARLRAQQPLIIFSNDASRLSRRLYAPPRRLHTHIHTTCTYRHDLASTNPPPRQSYYRGTSLIRKRTPRGPYRRPMPRVLGGVLGGWAFCYGRSTPVHFRQFLRLKHRFNVVSAAAGPEGNRGLLTCC